jgi:hypothetical protein
MKWSDLPTWVKVIIITVAVLLIAYVIKLAIDYFRSHKHEIYQKLKSLRRQINQLVSEKQRIIRALVRARLYTHFTISLIKVTLLIAFVWFTDLLTLQYKIDMFSALATSAGTVVTIYSITACLFDFKIRGLNELKELIAYTLEDLYKKRLNADPEQIIIIDSKINTLKQEAIILRETLNY